MCASRYSLSNSEMTCWASFDVNAKPYDPEISKFISEIDIFLLNKKKTEHVRL